MKFTFLGTGTSQGVPVIGSDEPVCFSRDPRDKRLRTSAMVEVGGRMIVIDTGPDFRQQMLREKVRRLDGVVFTHEHKDHTAGLDDIRPFYFLQQQPLSVYASPEVQQCLQRDYYYFFEEEKYPGVPEVDLHTITGFPFEVAGIPFTPVQVWHHKMPVYGFRIGDLTYITDANHIPGEEMDKVRGSRVLVLNALRHQPHLSHFTLSEAIEVVQEIGPEEAYFTHVSQYMGFHAEVEEQLPEGVHLAYDGLTLDL